ncbi:hypothetical protein GJ496_001162 [Pomphorhynchus laevis]|nr:hypothetical protein GJ496_001162 [Pomphorhynchus laevis]
MRVYRYMYKRFTSVMLLITAVCAMVCIELVSSMVRHCRESENSCYPPNATHHSAISLILMWICFVTLLICSSIFLICSRKLKGYNAADEQEAVENLPLELGR